MTEAEIKLLTKLNYGCGETNLPGYLNVDSVKNKITKPDIVADLKTSNLPFEDDHFEEILCLHCIEHIERGYWPHIFEEFYRTLKEDGQLIMAYPEFEVCARYFIENNRGNRDFWRKTLYGRQDHPGDYHVVPMRTDEVVKALSDVGFYDIRHNPEYQEEYNTFLVAKKGIRPLNRKELYQKEMFRK